MFTSWFYILLPPLIGLGIAAAGSATIKRSAARVDSVRQNIKNRNLSYLDKTEIRNPSYSDKSFNFISETAETDTNQFAKKVNVESSVEDKLDRRTVA